MSNRILTGLRANGEFHLGNYLGSMQPMAQIQNSLNEGDDLLMFIPDLHSFTTPIDHSKLYQNIINNVKAFIAAGIDPGNDKTLIYRQSDVPAHSELTVILNNFTYFGEASRMTEFKDKSERLGHKAITVGLFDYPVLMSADILLYGANYVPLGDDQKQHMELCRTIAERFNNKFGDIFVVPGDWKKQLEFVNREFSVRIKSLSDPSKKMSKSIDDPKGTINLNDTPGEAAKKVMSATTDSLGKINFDPDNQPGISNLLTIGALLEDKKVEEFTSVWQDKDSYGDLKNHVAQIVERFLIDHQEKLERIDDDTVRVILERSAIRAKEIAGDTLANVHTALGLKQN